MTSFVASGMLLKPLSHVKTIISRLYKVLTDLNIQSLVLRVALTNLCVLCSSSTVPENPPIVVLTIACVADGFLGEDLRARKLGRENCARAEKRVFYARPFLRPPFSPHALFSARAQFSRPNFPARKSSPKKRSATQAMSTTTTTVLTRFWNKRLCERGRRLLVEGVQGRFPVKIVIPKCSVMDALQ